MSLSFYGDEGNLPGENQTADDHSSVLKFLPDKDRVWACNLSCRREGARSSPGFQKSGDSILFHECSCDIVA